MMRKCKCLVVTCDQPWCPLGSWVSWTDPCIVTVSPVSRPVIDQSLVTLDCDWLLTSWLTGHPGHGADTCQCSGRDCESISQWPAPAPVHRTGHPQVRQHHPQPRDCHQHQKCLRKHQVLLSSVDILHCLSNCFKVSDCVTERHVFWKQVLVSVTLVAFGLTRNLEVRLWKW